MRALHPSARTRRRSFLASGGRAPGARTGWYSRAPGRLWNHFRPWLEILEDRRMLAVYTVNSTLDLLDAAPGDGSCLTPAGAQQVCTLRAAIMETNANSGLDTIELPSGTYPLSLAGAFEDAAASGDLDVTDDLIIQGASVATTIVTAAELGDRVFHVLSTATSVLIDNVTITGADTDGRGAGGGGIFNQGMLTIANSQVQFNSAPDGGGIYNDSTGNLTITSSGLAANSADESGGSIFNVGALKVTGSTIETSQALNFGGGLHNLAGTVAISGSSVSGGNLAASGGGISNVNAGAVTIDDSTIAGNFGGGIYNSGGAVTLESSTVKGNFGPDGAGIRNADAGTLSLTDTTVSANSTGTSGGGIYNASGAVSLTRSNVTGNTASTSGGGIYNQGNLTLTDSTMSGNSAGQSGGGINNQGTTLTLVDTELFDNSAGVSGGGIYSASGSVSLTGSELVANAASTGDGGGIYCEQGSLSLTNSTVALSTAKANGGGIYHLQGFATLTNSTVSGNTAETGSGGGIYSSSHLTLTDVRVLSNEADFESEGGGIFSSSLLNVADSTIEDNHAGTGGGISASGIATITGSTIADNVAVGLINGGGGGIHSTGTLSLDSSRVLGNIVGAGSPIGGGGILHTGSGTIAGSTIADNATLGIGGIGGMPGGGIASSGALTLRDSAVSGNSAHVGGGIDNSGILTVINSTISNNENPTTGFGLSGPGAGIFTSGIVTLTNATLYNNVALVDPVFNVGDGASIFVDAGGIATVRNTIIGDDDPTNVDNECFVVPGGIFTSLGHNLDTGATCGLAGPGDLSGVHPLLGPLQDNGGPTFTHALLENSPAIDAGDNSAAAVTGPFDQRGFTRVADGNGDGTATIDIGAYERVPLDAPIGCAIFMDDQGTLFVIADRADNDVAIAGTERGVQVSCDGRSKVFAGVSAVSADLGGGNDRVTIRDDQGPLANVNWKLIAGSGNDQIDAVMQSNPNELFVEAGLGDDDVSIRFIGIPNLPEPGEPMPVIDVDMGAGVDGLLLDIFGSRASPPIDFAAAGITPSATLLEVLTAIFIQGVGLLALLTLFPLGAMEIHQAIQDDRTGHVHETAAAIVLDAANFSADIQTGSTADDIFIGLVPRPDSKVKVNVKAGDADDEVTVSTKEEKDDDDEGSSLNEEVPVSAAAYELALDLGTGNDRLDLSSTTGAGPLDYFLDVLPGQFVLPEVGDEVIVAFEHGDIDKPFVLGTIWNPSPPPPNDPNAPTPTPGKLALGVQATGNQLLADLDVLGGNGPDVLEVNTELSDESIIYVLDISGSMSGGDDFFTYSHVEGPPVKVGSWILDSSMDVHTGPGNDRVAVALQPTSEATNQKVRIDTGDGDDLVDVEIDTSSANIPSSPCNLVGIDTGAGSDNVLVKVTGSFDEILIDLVTGEGDDTIQFEAADLHLADGGHADWSFLDGGGHDALDLRLVDSFAGNDVQWDWTTGGGGGDDRIKVHIDEVLIGDRFRADWSLEGGEGDNHIDFVRCGMIVGAAAIYSWSVGAGGGSDLVTVMLEDLAFGDGSVVKYLWNLGLGDDSAMTDASHLMLGMGTAFSWDITTGGLIGEAIATDDDRFTATLTGLHLAEGSSFDWLLAAGDGLDTIDTRWTGPTLSPGETLPGLINLALDSGSGNDSLATSFLDVPFDVTLNIAAAAGDDVIDTRWTGPTLIPDAPCQIVGIDAGLGSDAVTFLADGAWDEIDASILTGDGADQVLVGISNTTPTQGGEDPEPPEEFRSRASVSLRTGDRNDTVMTSFDVFGDTSLDIDTGTGNDTLNTIYVGTANGGVWKTTNSMGEGDDTATLAISPRDPASVLADSFFDVFFDLGSGDDTLDTRWTGPTLSPEETAPGLINLVLDSGLGNDSIGASFLDVPFDVTMNIAAGDGDDVIDTRWTGPTLIPDSPCVIVGIDAGLGSDAVALLADGAWEDLDASIVTGDGADGVTVLLRRLANPHLPSSTEEPPSLDQLEITTGAGKDTIDVQLESAAAAVAQKVHIDSGDGDDRVHISAPEAARDGLTDLIVGSDAGIQSHVKVFDGQTSAETSSFFPYGGFAGGVRVAAADVNGDGVADVVTGAGPGAGPHVKVFDGASGAELRSFFAYSSSFVGGVYVAAGDVNGDGRDDIITGAGAGAAGGHVRVFDGASGAELRSFFAYGAGFFGGVRVAAGDVNGDGLVDIVTGAGPGAVPHVKVFDGRSGAELHSFLAYGDFSGGVFVAAGDVDGDGLADIVTGTDAGASDGHVKVFSGATGGELLSFLAYGVGFFGGVRVAAGDVNGDGHADIVTGTGPQSGAGPHVKVFDGQTLAELKSFFAFSPSFAGGVFVAAGDLHSSTRPVSYDLDLSIETGAGRDTVNGELSAAADQIVQKVRIGTGAGNDSAFLQLLPYIEQDNLYQLHVDLGAGNDVARYWVFGTELPPTGVGEQLTAARGQLEFQVLGGLGSDDIQGRIGTSRSGQSLSLALGQALFNIDGGGGNDRISLDFRDTIFDDESVEAILHGGDGNDHVRARFELGLASTGMLTAEVFGDAGNDDLGLAIFGDQELEDLIALLDGGRGRDKCRVTRNVIVRNCESIRRV